MRVLEEVAEHYQPEMKVCSDEEIYNQTTSRESSPRISEVNQALDLISSLKKVDCYFFQKVKEDSSYGKI